MTRGIDGADVGAPLLVGGRQEHGHRVVDDSGRLHILDAAAVQGLQQQVIHHFALHSGGSKFLGPDDELGIIKVSLLGREGEGMAQQVLLLMVALDGLVNELCQQVKHLLGGGISADIVILAFHLQGLGHLLQDLELALALQADQQHAHIGAAEVQCQVLALLLAGGQAQVGFQHAQGGFIGVSQPLLEVIAEISRNGLQLLLVHGEFLDDAVIQVLVKSHFSIPFDNIL